MSELPRARRWLAGLAVISLAIPLPSGEAAINQPPSMTTDASNAVLPTARTNLALGTASRVQFGKLGVGGALVGTGILQAFNTTDTGWQSVFGTGMPFVFANHGGGNGFLSYTLNDLAPNTFALPVASIGYGRLAASATGNQVFGLYGLGESYAANGSAIGAEMTVRNYSGVDGGFVPDCSIGTASVCAIGLNVTAGGNNQSSIGIQIAPEGGSSVGFKTGLYIKGTGYSTTGLYVEDAPSGSALSALVKGNPNQNLLQLQTVGTQVPGGSAVLVSNGASIYAKIAQNGDYLGGSLTAGWNSTYPLTLNGGSSWTSLAAASGASGILLMPSSNGSNAALRLNTSSSFLQVTASDPGGSTGKNLLLNGSLVTLQQSGVTVATATSAGLGLSGATSGSLTLAAPAMAGSNTITFPAGTTNFSVTGGTGKFVAQSTPGGGFTVVTPTSRQIINFQNAQTQLAANSNYSFCYGGNGSNTTNEASCQFVFPIGGTIKNLYVNLGAAPGSGNNALVVVKTGNPGSLAGSTVTCTIGNTSTNCNDSIHSVAVTAGQLMTVNVQTSAAFTASNFGASIEFDNP